MSAIALFIIVPCAIGFLLPLFGTVSRRPPFVSGVITMGALCAGSLYLLASRSATDVVLLGGWISPVGVSLVADGFSRLMLALVQVVSLVAIVYSGPYLAQFTSPGKFYCLVLCMVAGLNGVLLTGDIFTLFVFTELAALSCYALVAFGTEHEELEASLRYLVLGTISSLFIVLGVILVYASVGSLTMADISRELALSGKRPLSTLITVLFFTGFATKAALVPFHAWLPDAHPSAPAPISALLSGVVIKVLGFYALVRLFFNVLGVGTAMSSAFIVCGSIATIAGAFLACVQVDLKRMLAYSTVSQVGIMIIGIGIGTPLAIGGALFHVVSHAFAKTLLFLSAGAVEYATGKRSLRDLGGLAARMPVTSRSAIAGMMSISGIPPFAGFWSKLAIIVAAATAGQAIAAGAVVISSVITIVYFARAYTQVFGGELPGRLAQVREVPWLMSGSLIVLGIVVTVMGLLLLPGIVEQVVVPAVTVITDGIAYGSGAFGGILP